MPIVSPVDCVHPLSQGLVHSSDGCDICTVAALGEANYVRTKGGKAAAHYYKYRHSKSKLHSITFRWTAHTLQADRQELLSSAKNTVLTATSAQVSTGSMDSLGAHDSKHDGHGHRSNTAVLSRSDTVTVYNDDKHGVLPNNLKLDVGGWNVLGQLGAGYWSTCSVNGKQPMRVGDKLRAPAGILEVIGFETALEDTHASCPGATTTPPASTTVTSSAIETTTVVSGASFTGNATGCDVCTAAAAIGASDRHPAEKISAAKLHSLVFTWSGSASPSVTAEGKVNVGWDGSKVTFSAHGKGALQRLDVSVDGQYLIGQPNGHGYEATCNLPMRIGDVLHSPTGTLTLTDFESRSGNTKRQCLPVHASTAAPPATSTFAATTDLAASTAAFPHFIGNLAGCDMCTGSAANSAAGAKAGKAKSDKARFSSIVFAWSGASGTSVKVHKAKANMNTFASNTERLHVYASDKLPLRLLIDVGGHRMEGQDGRHGYLTSCKESMHLGDMLRGPFGTLEVVGFQTGDGQGEVASCNLASGRIGSQDASATISAATPNNNGTADGNKLSVKGNKLSVNKGSEKADTKKTNVAKKNAASPAAADTAQNDALSADAVFVVISVGVAFLILLMAMVVLVKMRRDAASRYWNSVMMCLWPHIAS